MAKNYYQRSESKMIIAEGIIKEILKKNIPYHSGNIKNEFKISINDKEYTCVYWGHTNIESGDKVQIKLWKLPDNILLVDSIIITAKAEKEEKDEQ